MPDIETFSFDKYVEGGQRLQNTVSVEGILQVDGESYVIDPHPACSGILYQVRKLDVDGDPHKTRIVSGPDGSRQLHLVRVKKGVPVLQIAFRTAENAIASWPLRSLHACPCSQARAFERQSPRDRISVEIEVDCPKCGCFLASYSEYRESSSSIYVGAIVTISYTGTCFNKGYCGSGAFDWSGTVTAGKIIKVGSSQAPSRAHYTRAGYLPPTTARPRLARRSPYRLYQGEVLYNKRESALVNNNYHLLMQSFDYRDPFGGDYGDGNLVLYHNLDLPGQTAIWASNTGGRRWHGAILAGGLLVLDGQDGTVRMYGNDNYPFPDAFMELQANGNIIIFDGHGGVICDLRQNCPYSDRSTQ